MYIIFPHVCVLKKLRSNVYYVNNLIIKATILVKHIYIKSCNILNIKFMYKAYYLLLIL